MKKNSQWLLSLCIFAVVGVLLLQFFWIRNYYFVNRATFEKEANLAFEDALKKEFSLRSDTIEQNVFHLLLDTNEFILSNRYNAKLHAMFSYIVDRRNLKDKYYFSVDSLKNEVLENDHGPAKIHIAKVLAHMIREDDVLNHMVWYRTQKLGEFISKQELKYDFDTTRLRPIYKRFLNEREIYTPFVFYARSKDSTYNLSHFGTRLLSAYPVITHAYVTYKHDRNQHYIRAMFTDPFGYIIAKMGLMFAASILLIVVVAFSLFYLLRSLLTEKKLSLIKNDFISNITHELKTPIATVSAAVESLADFDVLNDPEKTRRYLHHSKKELQRLSKLVDTILTGSLYESGQFDISPERFNVDEVMNTIIANYKFGNEKRVAINYDNNSGLMVLYADKALFSQTIANVVDNAIKYSGNEVTIPIDCTVKGAFFVIAVKDNGIGILKKDIPYLFEKFYRVPTNAHKIKGHGLGLNYVKSIMERHKGWCSAASEYGVGTTIILGWPV